MYKVLYRNPEDNKLYSSIDMSPYAIEYKEGEEVRPNIGKLFIFEELEDTYYFITQGTPNYELWKVDAVNPTPFSDAVLDVLLVGFRHKDHSVDILRNYWENNVTPDSIQDYPPIGTYLCDSLTLVSRIL